MLTRNPFFSLIFLVFSLFFKNNFDKSIINYFGLMKMKKRNVIDIKKNLKKAKKNKSKNLWGKTLNDLR